LIHAARRYGGLSGASDWKLIACATGDRAGHSSCRINRLPGRTFAIDWRMSGGDNPSLGAIKMKATELLRQDHDTVKKLFEEYETAGEAPEDRAEIVENLIEALLPFSHRRGDFLSRGE